MNELEEKLSALISNPQLMQQISAMAQSMSHTASESVDQNEPGPPGPSFDPQHMQAIFQTAGQNSIDNNQQALLRALSPYLSSGRVQKLERAMRAAKLAGAASVFLNSGGLQLLTGR